LSNGFKLEYEGPRYSEYEGPRYSEYEVPRYSVESKNLKSAYELPFHTLDKINTEIHQGRVIGPFVLKPISTLHVSPIGVIPKKNGKYGLIIH